MYFNNDDCSFSQQVFEYPVYRSGDVITGLHSETGLKDSDLI